MAQLITWDTCLYSVANMHFNSTYACVYLAIAALSCFLLFYAFQILIDKKVGFTVKLGDDRCEKILRTLIMCGTYLLAAFLIYFYFVFKPDAVQVQVDDLIKTMRPEKFIEYMI